MRAWRHPSEIAAAAAAAARELEPAEERGRRKRLLATAMGSLTFIAAVVAAGALAVGASFLIGADKGAPDLATGTTDPSPSLDPASRSVSGSSSRLGSESIRVDQAPPATTTTTTPPTTAPPTSVVVNADGTMTAGALLDPDLRPDEPTPAGVFGLVDGRLQRLAGYTLVEDLLLTSVSAMGEHDSVALVVAGDTWAEATVIEVDPTNDIALLELGTAGDTFLDTAMPTGESPAIAAPSVVDNDTTVRIVGSGDETPPSGTVVGNEGRTLTRSGFAVYDALLIETTLPPGAPGSAVVDENDNIVGLVIDGSGQLTAAIPIERAFMIGRAFQEWGFPSMEWMGVRGSTNPDGGVVVESVATEGPAGRAGLEPGDLISAYDGSDVIDWDHLVFLIRKAGVGTTMSFEVMRSDTRVTIDIPIGSRLDDPATQEAAE